MDNLPMSALSEEQRQNQYLADLAQENAERQKNLLRQHHTRRIRRNDPRTVPHGQGRETMLSGEWFLVCDGLRPYLFLSPRRDHSKES